MAATPPPPDIVARVGLPLLFQFVQAVQLGVILHFFNGGDLQTQLTSWWRDPARNSAVGGHPASGHLAALAMDFSPPPFGLAEAMRDAGLHVVEKPRVLHVQLRPPPILASLGLSDLAVS